MVRARLTNRDRVNIRVMASIRVTRYGHFYLWIIIGSDRRPETKQGIEGKIDRFRSGRVRVRDRVIVRFRSRI